MNLEVLGWGEPFASAFAAANEPGRATAGQPDRAPGRERPDRTPGRAPAGGADRTPARGADRSPARVVAVHRGRLALAGAHGESFAVVAGALRERPTVGDWVAVDGRGVVRARLARRGALARAGQDLAANVDVAFVVTSPNRDLNARRLERFVAVAGAGGCAPVLVVNKSDLIGDLAPALAVVRAAAPGVPVVVVSALRGDGLDALTAHLGRGRTGVLLGSSGVGKSTLVNALLGGERQATAQIRARDDRGRHTTTQRALFVLPGDRGLLVDTPGLRLPRMTADPAAVTAAFADIEELAARCRFTDCRHETEPGCAVQAAIVAGELDPKRLRHQRKLDRERGWAASRDRERRSEASRDGQRRSAASRDDERGSAPRRNRRSRP